MRKKTIKVSELPTFDPARYLRDDKGIAAYLTQVIEDGDFGELAQALGVAARARGMTQIAETAGIGRGIPVQGVARRRESALRHHRQGMQGTGRTPCRPGRTSGLGPHDEHRGQIENPSRAETQPSRRSRRERN